MTTDKMVDKVEEQIDYQEYLKIMKNHNLQDDISLEEMTKELDINFSKEEYDNLLENNYINMLENSKKEIENNQGITVSINSIEDLINL